MGGGEYQRIKERVGKGREQLSPVVCIAKHAHYLLGVTNKVEESYQWNHVFLIKIEDVVNKKLGQ